MRESRGYWQDAFYRFKKDRMGVLALGIIILYATAALLAKFGVLASQWDAPVGASYEPPSFRSILTVFGTDIFGRSVLYKVIHGARLALSVGVVSSAISVPLGLTLGLLAGYFGRWVDECIVWFYSTISSIPGIMLLIAITYALGRGIIAVYIAMGVTSWIGLCRVIRGEVLIQKEKEYVLAAKAIGAGHFLRMFRHIVPNVFHFVILNLSLQFVGAIKAEVALSFLGLGARGQPSWGVMIDDAKMELARGVWWQLGGATFAMFFIVLAFNMLGDTLRDVLDPKVKI